MRSTKLKNPERFGELVIEAYEAPFGREVVVVIEATAYGSGLAVYPLVLRAGGRHGVYRATTDYDTPAIPEPKTMGEARAQVDGIAMSAIR